MKILEINWFAFLADLDGWMRLPPLARQIFSDQKEPPRYVLDYQLQPHHAILTETGFLRPSGNGNHLLLVKERKNFLRVIRALRRNTSLEKPSFEVFRKYASDYLTVEERNSLAASRGYYSDFNLLYKQTVNVCWLRQFLESADNAWERIYHRSFVPPYFDPPEIFRMGQTLVRDCLEQKGPIRFRDLLARYEDTDPGIVESALMGCIRYLLLFPWLQSEDGEPVLGIWPGIVRRLTAKPPQPPREVRPKEVFSAPLLIEDMTTLLVTAASEPPRVRAGDFELFAKAQKAIAKNLAGIPRWVEESFRLAPEHRIHPALLHAKSLKMVEQQGEAGQDLRFEVTSEGFDWLRRSAKERLKHIVDGVVAATCALKAPRDIYYSPPSLLPFEISFDRNKKLYKDVLDAMQKQFRELSAESFVTFEAFADYHARSNNPVLQRVEAGERVTGSLGWKYLYGPEAEEAEEAWRQFLWSILVGRLLGIGAVEVGISGDETLCIRLSAIGRYLFGLSPDLEFGEAASGEVVVQPNFDVVFLAPDPLAEAEISRFAERHGSGVGLLFKLTKKSVMRAAAGGLTEQSVSEALEQHCSKAIPNNVRREIAGWFSSCRRVRFGPAVLVRCPDAETATRVLGAAGGEARRLTQTVIELPSHTKKGPLARKLKGMGIFA